MNLQLSIKNNNRFSCRWEDRYPCLDDDTINTRSKIAFNAHRIYSHSQVLELFPSLQLKQYALIPDSHETGDILYGASETLTDSQNHGCGCFWFTKQDHE